jgi:DNA-binding transcriptional ArsR family regulator
VTKDDDRVFKALADPTRRHLLDRLFERDGRTLTELEWELEMTHVGVMKHLPVLTTPGTAERPLARAGRQRVGERARARVEPAAPARPRVALAVPPRAR